MEEENKGEDKNEEEDKMKTNNNSKEKSSFQCSKHKRDPGQL